MLGVCLVILLSLLHRVSSDTRQLLCDLAVGLLKLGVCMLPVSTSEVGGILSFFSTSHTSLLKKKKNTFLIGSMYKVISTKEKIFLVFFFNCSVVCFSKNIFMRTVFLKPPIRYLCSTDNLTRQNVVK